jgi:ferredoxin/flavodoxin
MNDNIIFFFSGTGNSFDITLKISEQIKNTDVKNIASIKNIPPLDGYKRVGLIFPIYGFTMPNIVSKFISGLPKNNSSYYFSIVTLGGLELGGKYRIHEAFNKVGITLDYISHVFMPENYIIFSMVPGDKLIKNCLEDSIKKVEKISLDIMNYKKAKARKSLFYNAVKKISWEETQKWPRMAKEFVISENCIKCKKCIRVCPVENIKMSDDRIIFDEHCELCLACMHSCPQKAINYGVKTINKKRYINPNIDIEELKKYC